MDALTQHNTGEIITASALRAHPVARYLAQRTSAGRASCAGALRWAFGVYGHDVMDLSAWQRLASYDMLGALVIALQQQRKATSTINHALYVLRGVLREAQRLGIITREALASALDVAKVKGSTDTRAGRDVSIDEAAQLSAALIDTTAAGVRDRAILALLWGAGLRRAELAALDVASLSHDGLLTIHGKGNKTRTIPLSDTTRAALEAWIEQRGREAGALFCSLTKSGRKRGAGLSAQAVYNVVKKYQRGAGLATLSPHDFRRSLAGNLLSARVDISTVAEMLGHASINTTMRYDRRGIERKRNAANMIPSPF